VGSTKPCDEEVQVPWQRSSLTGTSRT